MIRKISVVFVLLFALVGCRGYKVRELEEAKMDQKILEVKHSMKEAEILICDAERRHKAFCKCMHKKGSK